MSYATETAAISRTPITLCKVTLDSCSLTYGGDFGVELWGQDEVDYTEVLAGGSTFAESGGVFTLTRGTGNAAVQQIVTTRYDTYEITIVVTAITGSDLALTDALDSVVMDLSALGVGTHTVEYTQSASLSHLIIRTTGDGETVSWSSLSVKEKLAGGCEATGSAGEECYNTYPTCQDKANYTLSETEYKFTNLDAPYLNGCRPYLEDVDWMVTEIKPGKLTVKSRVTASFVDEEDTDIGIDPYVETRSSVQGTFWKKLLARNPNYAGRNVEFYQGYDGLAEGDFELRWAGNLDEISINRGRVKLGVVDELQALDKIETPPKLDVDLNAAIIATHTDITLTETDDMPAAGYILIDDEIISYASKNDTTNIVSGCVRGMFGTTAKEHDEETKVDQVAYYAPANPYDILEEMLTNSIDYTTTNNIGAGIAAARVDSTTFASVKAFPGDEPDFSAVIVKPVKLSKLFFEILDIVDSSAWVNEAQKITVRRNNVPNESGRTFTDMTDEANLELGSGGADLNEETRKSRITLYWDKDVLGEVDEVKDYRAISISIDADAESINEYNGIEERKVFCRWLRKTWGAYLQEETVDRYISNLGVRLLVNSRDAHPVISFSAELKDEAVQVGNHIKLSTDELQNVDGTDLADAVFSIWKRDPSVENIKLSAVSLRKRKIAIIAPNATPAWTSASETQQEYGFISNASSEYSDGADARRIY